MRKFRSFSWGFRMVCIAGLVFAFMISAYAALPTDIISYWKLDEAAGPDYEDTVNAPNGNNGVGNADPAAVVAGLVDGAQEFDGATTGIDVADINDDFDWGTDHSFSLECWMKPVPGETAVGGAVADREVMIGRDDGVTMRWFLGINHTDPTDAAGAADDGVLLFFLRDTNGDAVANLTGDGVPINVANPATNDWYHIVAVRDATDPVPANRQVRLYVNGNLVAFSAEPPFTGTFASAEEVNLGYVDLPNEFRLRGTLDEVAVYNKALSEAEIDQHFAAGQAGQALDFEAADGDGGGGGGGGGGGCFIATTSLGF